MKTLLLDNKQIDQKLNRLAFQIFEDNHDSKTIVIAGIASNGYLLAEKIGSILKSISKLDVILCEVKIAKHKDFTQQASLSIETDLLNGKTVILIDDVMNSGKTMLQALKPFMDAEIQKIRTLVLVDRNHKSYPVSSDFIGYSLATTLQDHVTVEFGSNEINAWLE